ncbi:MAG: type II restriction endonuclease [Brevundimonas sp.]|uniref:type II restriction endonuclease n=1 Tax=Brevundimonas sp. TaxID=1871086 RepID=UPI00180414AD|nr:type II restriction endonuclease [Brevundimonas sp.]MBA4805728.1 type II restriction endonuclease [Brevundimonas sp.]
MPVTSLPDWIAEFARPGNTWYLKRLSANDTLANGAHQAGPYFPKELLFDVVPGLHERGAPNPRSRIRVWVDSHPEAREVTAIWYNNRLRGGTRDETRITGWGGGASALLDPDSTGALAAFVFEECGARDGAPSLHVWVCQGYEDEVFEDLVGPVDPGKSVVWRPGTASGLFSPDTPPFSCALSREELPAAWLADFPKAAEIVHKTVELRPLRRESPDDRLLRRRRCEFELFQSVERAREEPRIAEGFRSIDDFLTLAQTILQRRKSRSGRSLELHAREILLEEGLVEGRDFDHGARSEGEKKPDFLFPSAAAYRDPAWPVARLRMLAAKTTARDRWRQVLNEADRLPTKHLLTLQEGVSHNQFAEMEAAGLRLVVPSTLMSKYPEAVRPRLMSFERFIAEVRGLA